jgi:nitrilase
MGDAFPEVKVAVVQASPILFDREATVEKALRLVSEARENESKLILFPEAFIPAYPRGLSFGTVVGGRKPEGRLTWERYWANSVDIPGPTTERLGEAAREANAYLAMGVIERDSQYSRGTLYCTLLYFGPDGQLLGKHRKIMPTAAERLIWGAGDGSTLTTIKTEIGTIGGLICWENYMPLARTFMYSNTLTTIKTEIGTIGGLICWENYMPLARTFMYSKGVEIYLAPTADARERWNSTLRHIALEGRCFVLGCNQYVTKSMYPADLEGIEDLEEHPEVICRGGSVIISPLGEELAGPLYDREDILYAELDLAQVVRSRFDFDAVGHYSRPDIFQLHVDERSKPSVLSRMGDPVKSLTDPEETEKK